MSGQSLVAAVLAGCCILASAKNYPCPLGYKSALVGACQPITARDISSKMEYNWNLLKDGTEITSNLRNYGVLILNTSMDISPNFMSSLWNNAAWRITVDGGTDRWLNYIKEHDLSLPLPNQVTGDFDSIKPETLERFKNTPDVDVVETPDQDFTDFEKALNEMFKANEKKKIEAVLVLSDNGGRLDQTFSNVNTLYKTNVPVYLVAPSSLTWLLNPGTHHIDIPADLRENSESCGILPFHVAKVKTTGLKWDLDNWTVEFGGLISSSNTYSGLPVVTITTDKTIIWTMDVGKRFLK